MPKNTTRRGVGILLAINYEVLCMLMISCIGNFLRVTQLNNFWGPVYVVSASEKRHKTQMHICCRVALSPASCIVAPVLFVLLSV